MVQTKTECPNCKQFSFILLTNKENEPMIINNNLISYSSFINRDIVLTGFSLGVFIKCCTKCGYTGFFNHEIVKDLS